MTESTPAEWRNGTEAVEVSSGGIDVDVRRRLADGGVPAFEYVITSTRSATVDLMLTQTLPDAVDPDDVGFPADGQRRWTVRDETWMTYERRLQPGATIRTAWGVRLDAHPSVDPPEVHVVVADRASALEGSGGASLGDQSGAAADVRAADDVATAGDVAATEDDRGQSGPTVAGPGSRRTPTATRRDAGGPAR